MPTSEAHLCAVRAIADWIAASKITKGYLFRKFASGDRVAEANQPMVGLFEWKRASLLISSDVSDVRTISGNVPQQSH